MLQIVKWGGAEKIRSLIWPLDATNFSNCILPGMVVFFCCCFVFLLRYFNSSVLHFLEQTEQSWIYNWSIEPIHEEVVIISNKSKVEAIKEILIAISHC